MLVVESLALEQGPIIFCAAFLVVPGGNNNTNNDNNIDDNNRNDNNNDNNNDNPNAFRLMMS